MQVLFTFDYELFFGTDTGSVEKCMIEPTAALLKLSENYQVGMTFFIDVGYLIKLEELAPNYAQLQADLAKVKAQIAEMVRLGCSVQLHIHPHWEKSTYDGKKWQIVTDNCYKLDDFSDVEIEQIVKRYGLYLQELTHQPVHSFRAGGWCIQPFSRLQKVFKELNLRIDSSVFPGGKFQSPHYDFDFTSVPAFSSAYRFENDVCIDDPEGHFTEYPIASWRYSPAFYWRLYALGRLQPARHKMIGDGSFLAQPGRKKSVLTNFTWNHVSADGYYAGMLKRQAATYQSKGVEHFVIIGHPKGLTVFALEQIERFVKSTRNKYVFPTFSDLPCN